MRKIGIIAVVSLLLVAMTAAVASAAVNFKPGKATPTFTDNGLTLSAAGALSGLGNEDLEVHLTATGTPTADCVNPGTGEHRPPGQQPAEVTLTGTDAIPAEEIKNGNVSFLVTTSAPETPVPGAPGCPNSRWIENITDVTFTSATITVEQPPGTVVLSRTFTL
jgi:hypothetical protein